MTTTTLDTIKMTRQIRDALYEEVKDMSLPERLAFYRTKAQAFHHQVEIDEPSRPLGAPASERMPQLTDSEQLKHTS